MSRNGVSSPGGGPGAGRTANNSDYFVDTKLLFRLKRFVTEQQERGSLPTEDAALDYLLDKFKEYVRKPQGPLRKSVGKALRKCLEGSPTPPRDTKKRSRMPEGGGVEAVGLQQNQHRHQHQLSSPREETTGSSVVGRQRKKRRAREGGGDTTEHNTKSDHEDLSEDELAAREAEAGMQGRTHNLLNQSVAAGYRTNGASSRQGLSNSSPVDGKDQEGGGSIKGEKKRSKRPRPGGPTASSRAAPSAAAGGGGGGGGAAAAAGYDDLGGISEILQEVRELIEYPLVHPEVYAHLGIEPPRGILLHGPPGCGKTLLANAIAGELDVAFLRISAPEIVSGMSGESEQKVRELFRAAIENAPCIVFMDEVDAITPKRETSSRGMEKRIVAQLLTCMDSLTIENTGGKPVVVIGATNRPNDLDSALRRAGRFDREICLGVPDLAARARILEVMASKMTLAGDVDFQQIAKKTPGFVGADLSSLTKEAAVVAINRIFTRLRATRPPPITGDPCSNDNGNGGAPSTAPCVAPPAATGKPRGGQDATVAPAHPEDSGSVSGAGAAEPSLDSVVGDASGSLTTSPASSTAVQQGKKTAEVVGAGAEDAAGAVGGFLTGPLSAAQLAPLSVTMEDFLTAVKKDFLTAVKKVQPSAKREGFATVPGVSWSDVGALASVREELGLSILEPIAYPERFEKLGLTIPAGVLLYGPPGCGKTLLAKAIANESGANFISVKGPELLDKYVGESEKSVRQVFQRARASSPCIIFFDELDALCPKRGGGGEGGGVTERVVNQLLTEMDGLEARKNVFVVAATNRPELIDQAMLRPGRLDRLLYVPLPSASDRVSILKALSATVSLGPDVDLHAVGHNPKAEGFSGADLAALLREAGLDVLRQLKSRELIVGKGAYTEKGAGTVVMATNFDNAFLRTQPSVSATDRAFYVSMKDRLCKARAHPSEALPPAGGGDNEPAAPIPSSA
ncbi:conserved unknown protein [Ectocarpus siliculosus]|uniref:AAA+ ATPase domain-containing protein n=1 Tax=Ectocarpus siliculosus TaxID=2880 RepID=D7FQZ0_ECTSI|nr:conserved unknown protein [Ectocarpus siliculosus]|eukprot:CBJ26144.1 conserved unknown protein [Ectocarpus siliculosus]